MNESIFFDRLFARVDKAWISIGLVAACVLVFAGEMVLSRSLWHMPSDLLIRLGGNFAPAVQSGQPWRLMTAMFLHGGILHIVLNMVALWQAGQIVERMFGRVPYLLIYALSGLAGNLASLWWHPGPVSIGASGAIFGVYGALLAYILLLRGEMPLTILREIRSSTLAFIGYSLFAGFMIPGVDNANHVGGLAAGLLLGAGLCTPLQSSVLRLIRMPRAYGAIVLVGLACAGLWRTAPDVGKAYRDRIAFEQSVLEFAQKESFLEQQVASTLSAVRAGDMLPPLAVTHLAQRIAPEWDVALSRLSGMAVAPEDKVRRQVLVQYGTWRKQSVLLVARALETNDQRWMTQAESLRAQSDRLLLQWKMRESLEAARRNSAQSASQPASQPVQSRPD